nr:translation initiation factor IF-2-like [Pan paniscus]
MSGSPSSSSSWLRSPPPPPSAPPPPRRAPSQIQDTHKAAGRPRRAQHSRRAARLCAAARPAPAPARPPPAAAGSARGLRLAEGHSRGEARRGAAPAREGRGGRGGIRGAGPRVCERRPRAGSLAASLSLSRLSRVRLVRSLLLGFFPFFFPLSGVNAGKQEPQPRRAAAAAATHWGLARARALARAHAPARTLERPPPQQRRAEGPAQAGARKKPEPGFPKTCGAEPGRGARDCEAPPPSPAPPPPARTQRHARVPTRSRPHRTAPATPQAPSPPARLQKQCPRRRSGLRGAGVGRQGKARQGRGGQERGGVGGECGAGRGSLKTTTARLESAFPRFLKSFIVSCSCCKINKCVHAAFFSLRTGKPERGGRGAPGRKGTPPPPGYYAGHFHARLGCPRRCDRGARSLGARGERRGKGAARVARPGVARGERTPPPLAGPAPRKGGPDRQPREPRARPRGGRQRARRALGRAARGESPPSLRGRKCGGPG